MLSLNFSQKPGFPAFLFLCFLFCNFTFAQSDACTAPPVIAVNTTCINTNFNISAFNYSNPATEAPLPSCGVAFRDGWYQFTTDATTTSISVSAVTNREIGLAIYTGSCGTLTEVACTIPELDTASLDDIPVFPNTTYYLRLMRTNNSSGNLMNGTVCVIKKIPVNDNCSGALPITVNATPTCSIVTTGNTANGTQSLPGCTGSADDDVWYRFVATNTSHTITAFPDSLYDPVLELFSGSCGILTSMGCSDYSAGNTAESTTFTGLTIGATYFVRVYSWSNNLSSSGSFSICVSTPPAVPLNNECAGAISLTVSGDEVCHSSTFGDTSGSTQSMPGCIGNANDDVWYTFTAEAVAHTITVTSTSLNNAVIQVFSGSCGSLTSLGCFDTSVGFANEIAFLSGLTTGATYYVRVYSAGGSAADAGSFRICITTSCSPGNSQGITTLGCPSVIAGGLGLNGADPLPIECLDSGCVDLEATYLQLGDTSNYDVSAIPFNPPYQFGCLAHPISVNNDDVWSPIIDLPFDFCFFGNTYNKCIVSSNGAISFDLVSNVPGGYSNWSFATNLPSPVLFKNSIFGVYHDIDPRFGGAVGWELVTLNTGCRALVASWKDMPLYACNTTLYSGMMVLYENTNIIDIYIQEKNVCASWNGGRAIVGIQNAAGTFGITAPGRNALDAPWTVTNEAWRFTPSGATITSLEWFEGNGTSGTSLGNSDTVQVCPSVTTPYTAVVTYALCNGTTLQTTDVTTVTVNGSKVWNGLVDTDWNKDNNWTPVGIPDAGDCVVIAPAPNNAIVSGINYDAYGYSLRVLPAGDLTVQSQNNLNITNVVHVNAKGNLQLDNSASLIQADNVIDTGIIHMNRDTQPLYRFDYTYWNSPVNLQSGFTLGNLSPNTLADKYYHWQPSISGGTGNWIQESTATPMDPARGFIIRAPQSFSATPTVFSVYRGVFTGTPNNGDMFSPISFGTLGATSVNDKWNLIGNPYPSAVDAAAFINNPANVNIIDGTLYFWTHNSAISAIYPDPFYGDFVLNYNASDYAIWNNTGGVAATTGGNPPDGFIAAGSSFFVQSRAVAGSAVFKNSMRSKNNNTQFFRNGDNAGTEGQRVWLNMTNNSGAFSQILLGYEAQGTPEFDRGWDGLALHQDANLFYSFALNQKLAIQAKPLPFADTDQVPLGYTSNHAGNFSIRIDHFDPFFNAHQILLEDRVLGNLHDLKVAPYEFTTLSGDFNDRFVLRFQSPLLHTTTADFDQSVIAFVNDGMLQVSSSEIISKIEIYDVTGKHLNDWFPKSKSFTTPFPYAHGTYLGKITLEDGIVVNKKFVN